MKTKRTKLTSVILTLICAVAMYVTPAFALDYTGWASKSVSTPYGTLTGEFKLFNDMPDGYDFYIQGEVNSSSTFNKMYAEYEMVNYNSGATLSQGSKTVNNDNFVKLQKWFGPSLNVPVTIYGVVEVRHTQTYTARPTLSGTYGGI
jgi:hypothetical protein